MAMYLPSLFGTRYAWAGFCAMGCNPTPDHESHRPPKTDSAKDLFYRGARDYVFGKLFGWQGSRAAASPFRMVGMARCAVPVRQDGTNAVNAPFFPSPGAAPGDGDSGARQSVRVCFN
jgi:hypothetical protein